MSSALRVPFTMHPYFYAALLVASCAHPSNVVPETTGMSGVTLRLADATASAFIFENRSAEPVLVQAYGCVDADTYRLYNAGAPPPGPGLACTGGPFERDGVRPAEAEQDEWSELPLREFLVEPSGLATFVESRHVRHRSAATPTLTGEYRFRVSFRTVGSRGPNNVAASFRVVGASQDSTREALQRLQRRVSAECRAVGIGTFAISAPPDLVPELLSLHTESLVESRAVASAFAQRAEHEVHLETMLLDTNSDANLAASLEISSAPHASDAARRLAARHLSECLRRNASQVEVLRALFALSAEMWPRETPRSIIVLLAQGGELRDTLVWLISRDLVTFQAFYPELVTLLEAECCGPESQLRETIEVALGRRESVDHDRILEPDPLMAPGVFSLECGSYLEELERLLPPPRVVVTPG